MKDHVYENQPDLAGPALRTFFNIAALWGLDDSQKMAVLGLSSVTALVAWERTAQGEESVTLPTDALERISHVFAIYRALQTLLPQNDRAARWVRAPNEASTFGGKPALARMTSGNIADLIEVRRYLDAQLV